MNNYKQAEYRQENSLGLKERNPFLEALPPVLEDPREYYLLLTEKTGFTDEERKLPKMQRSLLINENKHYFVPMSWHYQAGTTIDALMRQTYIGRNPLNYIEENGALYRLCSEGIESLKSSSDEGEIANNCTIIGIPGIGKSTSVKRLLRRYGQVIEHRNYEGKEFHRLQVPYLWIQCPSSGEQRDFCISFFGELSRVLRIPEIAEIDVKQASTAKLMQIMAQQCIRYGVGLIIVDEIENILKAKEKRILVTEFLTELTNRVRTSICYIGSPLARTLLHRTMHSMTRMTSYGLITQGELEYGSKEWNRFATGLWNNFQIVSNPVDYTPEIDQVFYEMTGGNARECKSLFSLIQKYAIENGKQTDTVITPKFIRYIAENFKPDSVKRCEYRRSRNIDYMLAIDDSTLIDMKPERHHLPVNKTDKEIVDGIITTVYTQAIEWGYTEKLEKDFIDSTIALVLSGSKALEEPELSALEIMDVLQSQVLVYERMENESGSES